VVAANQTAALANAAHMTRRMTVANLSVNGASDQSSKFKAPADDSGSGAALDRYLVRKAHKPADHFATVAAVYHSRSDAVDDSAVGNAASQTADFLDVAAVSRHVGR